MFTECASLTLTVTVRALFKLSPFAAAQLAAYHFFKWVFEQTSKAGCYASSVVNEAKWPRTCRHPCAFEEKQRGGGKHEIPTRRRALVIISPKKYTHSNDLVYSYLLWICWEIPLTMWTEAVSISASRYSDTLSRQQKSRTYFLCSRGDDVML